MNPKETVCLAARYADSKKAENIKVIEWAYFHGRHPYKFLVDKRTGCDIDDGLDLACARAWLDMDESVSQIDPYIINGVDE